MRYTFIYPNSTNLGDDIQTLAAMQFLGDDVKFIPRDNLRNIRVEGKLLLNGWWTHDPVNCFPPKIEALPISMHLNQKFRDRVRNIDWFKGRKVYARDISTREWLKSKGIDSEFSGCLTLTFPKVETERSGIIHVDYGNRDITHSHTARHEHEIRRSKARQLLELYSKTELIITNRLHAALPSAAMGTPVVCIAREGDPRFTGMEKFITICTDGNVKKAIDIERQTRKEREANIKEYAINLRSIVNEYLND